MSAEFPRKDDAVTDRNIILIVDDTPDNISLLSELLRKSHRIKVATKGQKALNIAVQHAVKAAHAVTGAGILDALIGMQEVISNL